MGMAPHRTASHNRGENGTRHTNTYVYDMYQTNDPTHPPRRTRIAIITPKDPGSPASAPRARNEVGMSTDASMGRRWAPLLLLLSRTASTGAFILAACPKPDVAAVTSMAGGHSFGRSACVSMNLGERFVRLVKSNVNEVISNLEDPEKVLEQAVADMQKDLVKVRQAYAEVSASSKRMQEQIRLAEAESAKWYQRAQLALEKGEDDLAREALTRRKQQLEMADSLKEQIEVQESSSTSLYESMKQLEAKMAEAKAKKDQMIARARAIIWSFFAFASAIFASSCFIDSYSEVLELS